MKKYLSLILSFCFTINLLAQTGTPTIDSSEVQLGINRKNGGPKIIHTTSISTGSTLDGSWYLRKLLTDEDNYINIEDNSMWFELNTFTDNAKGFGSCNAFDALIKSENNGSFKVSKLVSSNITCDTKKLEERFFDLLKDAHRFEINNGVLLLYRKSNLLLEFSSSPGDKAIKKPSQNITPIITNESSVTSTKTTTKTVTTTSVDSTGKVITSTTTITTTSDGEEIIIDKKSENPSSESTPEIKANTIPAESPKPEQKAMEATEAAVAKAVQSTEEPETKKKRKSGKNKKPETDN